MTFSDKTMKTITSQHNEQLKYLAKLLSSSKTRRQYKQTVLEGVHLLESYLQTTSVPQQIFVPSNKWHHPEIQDVVFRLPENKITLVQATALSKISSLSHAEEVMTLIDLPFSGSLKTQGDCVVLERIQDAGNMGTILRSAAASGIRDIVLSKECVDVWSPKVLRAGMGAHFLLNIQDNVDLWAWRERYSERVLVTALSEHNHFALYDLDLHRPSAWVFGNEGKGVSDHLLAQADASVRIPMLGATESLNVAMAATICLFEQMRQRMNTSVFRQPEK